MACTNVQHNHAHCLEANLKESFPIGDWCKNCRSQFAAICSECGKWKFRSSLNGYSRCSACQEAIDDKKNFTKDFDLVKGDKIKVTAQGCEIFGTVLTAYFWGKKDGWYIEYMIDEQASFRPSRFSGNYGYWKQGCDGGTVEKITQEEKQNAFQGFY